MPKMKGHKPGCRCVGCSAATRKRGQRALTASRPRQRNTNRYAVGDVVKMTPKHIKQMGLTKGPIDGLVVGHSGNFTAVLWNNRKYAQLISPAAIKLKKAADAGTRAQAKAEGFKLDPDMYDAADRKAIGASNPKRRPRRKNHGYENQLKNLVRAERARPLTRINPERERNPGWSFPGKRIKAGLYIEVTRYKPGIYMWRVVDSAGKFLLPGIGDIHARSTSEAETKALARWKEYKRDPKKVMREVTGKRNSAVRISQEAQDSLGIVGNPAHFPRTSRGSKGKSRWWIFDLFDKDGALVRTSIEKSNGTTARDAARGMVGTTHNRTRIKKVQLSGPYTSKPRASTRRK